MTKKTISTILRFVTFALALWGVIEAVKGSFMGQKTFLYFTTQSNIAIGIVCLVFAILDVATQGKTVAVPRWLNILKFACTVAITLTFIVFWTVLAPVEFADYPQYLASADNILCHTLVPLCAIADWLLNSQNFLHKKGDFWWSVTLPLAYFIFAVVVSFTGVEFGYGAKVPYFFLDFYQYGWFGLTTFPFGVFWWILIILGIVLGIGCALLFFKKLCSGKSK